MNFLSIDCHIATSADIRYIFNQLGHQVTEYSLSGHASVVGRPMANIPMLNHNNWCSTINNQLFDKFYMQYKDLFNKYDGFIIGYPPVFSWLYKYFDKPIIMQIPIRYELGVEHTASLWEQFNEYLRTGIDEGKIHISANSVYDKKYTEGFIQRPINYIPSLCQYTGMSYNPSHDLFLYYSSQDMHDIGGRMAKKHQVLRPGHSFQTVADFKGCIHYPYNISTMSIFEQYMANQPLFFPSQKYMMELWKENKVLSQISWRQQQPSLPANSLIANNHTLDPNNYKDELTVRDWLNYADFYENEMPDRMKEIMWFDDEEEIFSLSQQQLLDISEQMKISNKERIKIVYEKWSKVLGAL